MKKLSTLVATLFLALFSFIFSAGPRISNYKIGDKMPAYELTTLMGNKLNLDTLKGKEILLSFTATRCPYCIDEKIILNEDFKHFAKDDKLAVAVIFGPYGKAEKQDTPQKALEYMKKNKYTFPAYFDHDSKLKESLGLNSVPTSILIDKDGTILDIQSEYYNVEKLQQSHKLKKLKKEKIK